MKPLPKDSEDSASKMKVDSLISHGIQTRAGTAKVLWAGSNPFVIAFGEVKALLRRIEAGKSS